MPSPGEALLQTQYERLITGGVSAPAAKATIQARIAKARGVVPVAEGVATDVLAAGLLPEDDLWAKLTELLGGEYGAPLAAGVEPAGGFALLPSSILGGAGQLLTKLPTILAALGIGSGVIAGIMALVGGGNGGAVIPGTDIALGGPGLAEPSAANVVKEWSTGTAQFYQLTDGRIAVYSKKKKRWTAYRPARHIVISRNPRMGTLLRASKRIDRLWTGISRKAGKYLRKKVVYGQAPGSMLSAVERKALARG